MKINKNDLQEALSIVKPGLATKELLVQTTSFAFIGGRVITYNDEISISHPINGIDFTGAIKAEELYGLLTKIKEDEIEIEVTGDELKIKAGKVKAGLRLETDINLPLQESPNEWKKIKKASQFIEYIKLAGQTCGTDMSDSKLTCVCVRGKNIIGSDGQRLIQCSLKHEMPVKEFLLPAINVVELIKIKPTHIQLEEDWIYFKNDKGTIFSCRTVKDIYMPQHSIDPHLLIDEKAKIKFPDNILEILSRVMSFSKREFALEEIIEVTIKNGKVTFSAETENTKSWIKEKMIIKSNVNLFFSITPSLFIDILKSTKICQIDKSMTKGKFILKDRWEYIVMFRQPSKK